MNRPSKPTDKPNRPVSDRGKPRPPRRAPQSETDLMFADDASTAMKMTDKAPGRPNQGAGNRPPRQRGSEARGPQPRGSGAANPKARRTSGPKGSRSQRGRPKTGRMRPGNRPPSGRIAPNPNKGPRPPKPQKPKLSKPAKSPTPPATQRRKKGIVVKRGEYFDGPSEEEELAPLDQVALPRSLIEEEEEKDFRKRFNRSADEDVVDIYSADRHAAVTVKDSDLDDDSQRKVGSRGFLVVVTIILAFAFSGAIVFMFRDKLREPLAKIGITLPR